MTRALAAPPQVDARVDALTRQLAAAQRELERANHQLGRLSLTDHETGLPNRRAIQAAVVAELSRSARRPSPLSVVMVDIDHLRRINDRYGRRLGDAVVAAIGGSLITVARDTDLIGRYGGEEFTAVLYDCPLAGAEAWAERFRDALTELVVPGVDESVTASFGVATAAPSDDADALLERADRALQQAKRSGRDRVVSAALLSNVPAMGQPHRSRTTLSGSVGR